MKKYKGIKMLTNCPKCHKSQLSYFEILKGQISSFSCPICGARFDASVYNDLKNDRHYYLGNEENPEYWLFDTENMEEIIKLFEERDRQGISPYLKTHPIAEIIFEESDK